MIRVFLDPKPHRRRIDLHVLFEQPGQPNKSFELDALVLREADFGPDPQPAKFVAPGAPIFDPQPYDSGTMQEFLQALVNAAWDAGIRPLGAKESAGEIKRIEKHLADMQRLVFQNEQNTDRRDP